MIEVVLLNMRLERDGESAEMVALVNSSWRVPLE
jgi:hypothetical protein